MPVIVECSVRPSRRRWWVIYAIFGIGVALFYLLGLSVWLCLIWFLVPWLAFHHWRSEPAVSRLRLSVDSFDLWFGERFESFQWSGLGRISHAFIRFELNDEEQGAMTLTIWKDSVTEPSWRALNMAFRVLQPGCLKSTAESPNSFV